MQYNHPTRRFLVSVLMVLAATGPVLAKSVSFADCTASDEDALREVYDFVYDHVTHMWDDVDANQCGNRDCNYISGVSSADRGNWENDIESITIRCLYNSTNNGCANNPGRLGRCQWPNEDFLWVDDARILWDASNIRLCMDNIRTLAGLAPEPDRALLAGVIAHEVMHQGDGTQMHNGDGTEPWAPDTTSETVGTSMEHVYLSPDLRPEIVGVWATWDESDPDGPFWSVSVEADIHNDNAASATAGTTTPQSGYDRNNVTTTVCLKLDGAIVDIEAVTPLNGLAWQNVVFETLQLDTYTTSGYYDIEVEADCGEALWELDETDNAVTQRFDLETDLAIRDVRLAAAPVEHAGEYVEFPEDDADARPDGYYNWVELTYDVTAENVSETRVSPPIDVVLVYDDMWSDDGWRGQQEVWIESLDPGETTTVTITVDIPMNSSLTSPIGETDLDFVIDFNVVNMNDVNRDNNFWNIVVDADYWKPDYTISIDAVDISDGTGVSWDGYSGAIRSVLLTNTLRNNGPVAPSGTTGTWLKIDDTLYARAVADGLEPAEELTMQATVELLDTMEYSYEILLVADGLDVVEESDESNNTAGVTVAKSVQLVQSTINDMLGQLTMINDFNYDETETYLAEMIRTQDNYWPDTIEYWNDYTGNNGPFLPDPENMIVGGLLLETYQWRQTAAEANYWGICGSGCIQERMVESWQTVPYIRVLP